MRSRYWVMDSPHPNFSASVYENGYKLCAGLSWLQATEFCKGRDLVDLGVVQLSLF